MHDVDTLIEQLRPYVASERVLDAIVAVPRECFVPAPLRDRAYDNRALAIGCGQTISQPLVVARMSELLDPLPDGRVLDVGTGSGYHAAVLARLSAHVWSIEVHAALSAAAADSLAQAGAGDVTLVVGDGSAGLPDEAPFDAINVAAAGPVDRLAALLGQLGPGGRLVAPVSDESGDQHLCVFARRESGDFTQRRYERVRFVPLVG